MTTSHQLQADHGQERRCSVQVSSHMSQSNTTEGEILPEYNYNQNYNYQLQPDFIYNQTATTN